MLDGNDRLRISSGTVIISDAGSRDANMCDTTSLVLQLAPKSNVTTCFTKISSCIQYGSSMPSCLRMLAICSGLEILPQQIGRITADHVEQRKDQQDYPAIVGIILPQSANDVCGHDLVTLALGCRSTSSSPAAPGAACPEQPTGKPSGCGNGSRRVPRRIGLELLRISRDKACPAPDRLGSTADCFIEFVVAGLFVTAVVGFANVLAVEQLREVVAIGVVGDPRRAAIMIWQRFSRLIESANFLFSVRSGYRWRPCSFCTAHRTPFNGDRGRGVFEHKHLPSGVLR